MFYPIGGNVGLPPVHGRITISIAGHARHVMADIADKEQYADLTETQKRAVDAIVNDPTAQNTELADAAGVSRATVFNVKEHYSSIIETQLRRRFGPRFTSASSLLNGEATADGGTDGVRVELSRDTAADVLAGESCDAVRPAVVSAVVDRAFPES